MAQITIEVSDDFVKMVKEQRKEYMDVYNTKIGIREFYEFIFDKGIDFLNECIEEQKENNERFGK